MLWKWTALMQFAHFPTINSLMSNAGDLKWQSRHVVGISMEIRRPMKMRDGSSELPHLNKG
jgi:hypothetical protein